MIFLAQILTFFIHAYIIVIVVDVVVSWLIAFKVLDTNNPQAQNLVKLLKRLTDPVMKPVQKYVPPIGGIDLTPIIVIIGLNILITVIWKLFVGGAYYAN